MRAAQLETLFWAAAIAGEVILTLVLLLKGRWHNFPAFTAFIAIPAVSAPVFFFLERSPNLRLYTDTYRCFVLLTFFTQLAVVWELARIVLKPTGTWVRDARKQFILLAALATLVALAFAYAVSPPAPDLMERLELRSNLFASMLICELCIAISFTANSFGLVWRSHVISISQGLMAWSTAAVVVDSLHSYFGTRRFYIGPNYITDGIYLLALGHWCVQLWREEPARQPISPELRNYIVALHRRVQYDLGEVEQ